MIKKKSIRKYYFSVEGETEQWYLKWLQDLINDTEASLYKVSIDCSTKDPIKHSKSITVTRKIEIYHFFDYESDEQIHVQRFLKTMDDMKRAERLGKQIKYKSGYSNFAFDLWMILHMADCYTSYADRNKYIVPINRVFKESFQSMNEYKEEKNFKRCLKKMSMSNVIEAIGRARRIMERNRKNGYTLHEYRGYQYYKENPSLTSWQAIEKILADCRLIEKHPV